MVVVIHTILDVQYLHGFFLYFKTEFQWSSNQDSHLFASAISVNTMKDCYSLSLAPFPLWQD
jgi:hypothetical protein